MPELKGGNEPVTIESGFTLEAPDLVGMVEVVDAQAHVRSSGRGEQEQSLFDALAAEEMETALMFEMAVAEDRAPTGPGGQRRDGLDAVTRSQEPAIVLRAEQSRPNRDYAVLYTDEQGVSRWIFPEDSSAGRQRRGRELLFYLPRASAPVADGDTEKRGPISKIGRRVVRMLMWATDEIVGQGVNAYMRKWENEKRPYGFRAVNAEEIAGEPDWDALQSGRALLLLHGTFSMGQVAFHGLSKSPEFAAISERYGGRIFTFNHPSLHLSPIDNVQTMVDMLPDGIELDLDIITHSRGALVARIMNEQLARIELGNRSLRVNRVVFVAAPLRGTVLADGDNWIELIDRYTNLLTNLPDNVYTLTLEAILALVKIIGHSGLAELVGINSMWPGGPFLQMLNSDGDHDAVYYSLSVDYRPEGGQMIERLRNRGLDLAVDHIFGEGNDGVVPTAGCYSVEAPVCGLPIPEERRRVWSRQSDIHHINFFYNDAVNAQIAEWLTA